MEDNVYEKEELVCYVMSVGSAQSIAFKSPLDRHLVFFNDVADAGTEMEILRNIAIKNEIGEFEKMYLYESFSHMDRDHFLGIFGILANEGLINAETIQILWPHKINFEDVSQISLIKALSEQKIEKQNEILGLNKEINISKYSWFFDTGLSNKEITLENLIKLSTQKTVRIDGVNIKVNDKIRNGAKNAILKYIEKEEAYFQEHNTDKEQKYSDAKQNIGFYYYRMLKNSKEGDPRYEEAKEMLERIFNGPNELKERMLFYNGVISFSENVIKGEDGIKIQEVTKNRKTNEISFDKKDHELKIFYNGKSRRFDEVFGCHYKIWKPKLEDKKCENDKSVYAVLEYHGTKIGMFGDMGEACFEDLKKQGADFRCDVVILPHHGHEKEFKMLTKYWEEFPENKPKYIMVSEVYSRKGYNPKIIQDYCDKNGMGLYTTDRGHIEITIDKNGNLKEPYYQNEEKERLLRSNIKEITRLSFNLDEEKIDSILNNKQKEFFGVLTIEDMDIFMNEVLIDGNFVKGDEFERLLVKNHNTIKDEEKFCKQFGKIIKNLYNRVNSESLEIINKEIEILEEKQKELINKSKDSYTDISKLRQVNELKNDLEDVKEIRKKILKKEYNFKEIKNIFYDAKAKPIRDIKEIINRNSKTSPDR